MINFFEIERGSASNPALRTDVDGLVDPRAAQECLEAGTRLFEIPFVSETIADVLPGIARLQEVAERRGITIFIAALIPVTSRTARHFTAVAQEAINAGVTAIRIECSAPSRLIDRAALSSAHDAATQAGIAFFGDGCDDYLQGARLYRVNETGDTRGREEYPPSEELRQTHD